MKLNLREVYKMKYLVTGVRGQLGYDVCKELRNRGYNDILEASSNIY